MSKKEPFHSTVGQLVDFLKTLPQDLPILTSGYENGFENFYQPDIIKAPKQWMEKTNAIRFTYKAGRYGGTCGIAKCDTFKAAFAQQVVSQLIQITWEHNFAIFSSVELRSNLLCKYHGGIILSLFQCVET